MNEPNESKTFATLAPGDMVYVVKKPIGHRLGFLVKHIEVTKITQCMSGTLIKGTDIHAGHGATTKVHKFYRCCDGDGSRVFLRLEEAEERANDLNNLPSPMVSEEL